MIIDGNRALAWVARIDSVTPLSGYDRVEYAHIGGWGVVVSKADAFAPGDLCIYFEIDSKVPEGDPRFAFMEKRKWHVKTQKMCKVYSQGLIMPLSAFPEVENPHEKMDVTDALGVTYYVRADNERKARVPATKNYKSMAARHPKLFATRPMRALMKNKRGRELLYRVFGEKKQETVPFPTKFEHIHKTDEERIENLPEVLQVTAPFVVTEKVDGTSCTYILERTGRTLFSHYPNGRSKYEFWVCSRNRRLDPEHVTAQDATYFELAEKYDIEAVLRGYLNAHPSCSYICIQGEGVGPGIQGNPLRLPERRLFCFNLITSDVGRWKTADARRFIGRSKEGLAWVPVVDECYHMPATGDALADMEEVKLMSDGMSEINPRSRREGLVFRDDKGLSFKSVSRRYLEKKKEG